MPPIDPPTTAAQRSMPSASASAASTATWSRIVMRGKRDPYGCRRGASDAGPVVPWQPPSTFGHTTKQRSVSIARAGADRSPSHHPRRAWPGSGGPGRVAVAGERVQHEDRVRRVGRELAPGLVRDGRPPEPSAGLERANARSNGDELPPPRVVAGAPRAGDGQRDRRPSRQRPLAARKPGLEVGQDVVERLDAHGQAHEVVGDPGGDLLLGLELRVRRGRRVDGQAAHVADVGEVAEQLERVDELLARLEPALDPEREDRARARSAGTSSPARSTGSTRGPGTSPTRPRRAPRATARPRARSASDAPCAGSASRDPAGRGTR